jgi:iron(III) transport system substrate-binding protein
VQEGSASPADVFLTENSPAMSLVDSEGLFAPLDAKTLRQVPEQYAPDNGHWMGFAARSTVLVYNTDLVSEADLPESILELAEPQWRDRIAFSPTGADFQAIVSAVLELEGRQVTEQWLEGLAANGTVYDGNDVVMESVNSGEVDAGVIYHYYWYRDQQEAGDNSSNSRLHFFDGRDPARSSASRAQGCSRRATRPTTPSSSWRTSPARLASRTSPTAMRSSTR